MAEIAKKTNRYPTDLTDEDWEWIMPPLPKAPRRGRKPKTDIHTVLTDSGMAFADLPKNRDAPPRRHIGAHIFDRVCSENGIEHRL